MASSPSSSCSSTPPAVRVVEQCRVSPSREGLLAPLGEVSLPFTFFDIFWFLLGSHAVQRLFFYRCPDLTTASFVASALPRLKRTLSLALRHYYPLAGSLRRLPGSSDKFHIHCTDGDSVPFTLADCDGGSGHYFFQLTGDHARGVEMFRPLVPEIPAATEPGGPLGLTALQVTVFPGAGVCIGVSIHHVACDGSGFMGFVKSWASACRSEEDAAPPAVELPVIDRTLVSDPNGLSTVFYDALKSLTGVELPPALTGDGPAVVRSTFLLKRAHIEELRRRVSEWRPPPFRYSSFVLTCAYVWVCLLKARRQPPPPPPAGDVANLVFAVDYRGRLRPPLPTAYFGNCIGACFVDAQRSDLVGEGGVGRAAEAIAVSVARLEEDGEVLRGAEDWVPKSLALLPLRPLSIAGSPRFGVYGVDFGWGPPAKVEVAGIERTGAMSLADSREVEGAVEVGLALPAPEMAKFSSLFAAGLEDAADGAKT